MFEHDQVKRDGFGPRQPARARCGRYLPHSLLLRGPFDKRGSLGSSSTTNTRIIGCSGPLFVAIRRRGAYNPTPCDGVGSPAHRAVSRRPRRLSSSSASAPNTCPVRASTMISSPELIATSYTSEPSDCVSRSTLPMVVAGWLLTPPRVLSSS